MLCAFVRHAHDGGGKKVYFIVCARNNICVLPSIGMLPFVLVMPDWFLAVVIGRILVSVIIIIIVHESVTKPSDETIT
jgi:hypothetical protein